VHYQLHDLIDIGRIQDFQDRLNELFAFPSAILDAEGNILSATHWREVCAGFHKNNTTCARDCAEKDRHILQRMAGSDATILYECPHGLVDTATPIVVEGSVMGAFLAGQFFLQEPNLEIFKTQARQYGFDEQAYLEAVKRVPVWSRDTLQSYLYFVKALIAIISQTAKSRTEAGATPIEGHGAEHEFRAMFEMASIGIAQADPATGRLLRVNRRICEITGYSEEELLARTVADITHPDDRDKDWEDFQRCVRGEIPHYNVTKRHVCKDGRPIWVNVNMTIIRDEGGRPLRTLATIEDFSERKRNEEAQRENEARRQVTEIVALQRQRFFSILDQLPALVCLLTEDHQVAFANKPFLERFGDSKGRPCHKYLFDLDEPCPFCEAFQVLKTGQPHRWECPTPNGGVFDVSNIPFTDVDGTRMILEMDIDITERKKNEKELAMHRAHLEELVSQRTAELAAEIQERRLSQEQNLRLEIQLQQSQKMEAIGQLAGGIAHDFNNLLQVISANAEIAQGHPAEIQRHEAIDGIQKASQRAADLVRQLLAFSRRQTIQPANTDLNTLIEGVLKMIRRVIGEHIELLFVPATDLGTVFVDKGQVEQVLMNLCVNARDAMPRGGRLIIKTGRESFSSDDCTAQPWADVGAYVYVSIHDTGHGMDADVLAHIFEPFYTTKDVGEGTGLGLATVYGIVKQHKGLIHVSSEPNHGSIFKIYFPVVDRPPDTAEIPIRTEVTGGTETILVAEDEPAVLKVVSMMLTGAGYRVLTACNGQEALDVFQKNAGEIDLLLLDVMMPGIGGREVMDHIQPHHPHMPFLFASGYSAAAIHKDFTIQKGLRLIQKPYRRDELLRTLRQLLDARKRD